MTAENATQLADIIANAAQEVEKGEKVRA